MRPTGVNEGTHEQDLPPGVPMDQVWHLPPRWRFEFGDSQRIERQPLPLRWRTGIACAFVGGVLVVMGALVTLVIQQTTPISART